MFSTAWYSCYCFGWMQLAMLEIHVAHSFLSSFKIVHSGKMTFQMKRCNCDATMYTVEHFWYWGQATKFPILTHSILRLNVCIWSEYSVIYCIIFFCSGISIYIYILSMCCVLWGISCTWAFFEMRFSKLSRTHRFWILSFFIILSFQTFCPLFRLQD